MIIVFITTLLFIPYAILITYYRQAWMKIPISSVQLDPGKEVRTFISVIIAARNEEENIQACLESITSQTYPKNLYEVIVVDDFSKDHTSEIVRSFVEKNVSLLSLKDFIKEREIISYKKKAIEIAVSKAKGELIVTTDADCIVTNLWLQTFASFYEKYDPHFIAAPVSYYGENNFLKIFQSLDFITLQGITGASVYKKFHSMCNGANLAYKKMVFDVVGGFTGIDNIASGDDMLLMHKIFKHYPDKVLFIKSADVVVKTRPQKTLDEFLNQRIRWASKADKYSDKKITAVLLLVYLFNLSILSLGIACIFNVYLVVWFMVVLFAKMIIELFFIYPVAKFFCKERLLCWFPLSQPFHVLYTLTAGWLGKFGSYNWKERKVK